MLTNKLKIMKKIIVMLFCVATLGVVMTSCQKETITPPAQQSEQNLVNQSQIEKAVAEECDINCGNEVTENLALRLISFGAVPASVFYNFNLAAASNVDIFAQDCCVRDDVVEIWVNGCLVATVDSRSGPWGSHPGETHTVTLPAGDHTIEYRNTVSAIGSSGWYVSETMLPASTIVIDGCDTGVPNIDLSCGNSMYDMIANCAVGATNHGGFVSCVAHLTNVWKKARLITGDQKDAIMDCAGSSNIP